MNKKLWIVIAACLVLAVALIIVQRTLSKDKSVKEPATTGKGNAQTGDEEEEIFVFGFSCADLDDPYYAVLEASLRSEIAKRGGQLSTKNARGSQEIQNRDMADFAEENVKAIFFVPVTEEGANETLRSLEISKIPVINLDSRVSDAELCDLYVGTDQAEAGALCAGDLVRRAPQGGTLVLLESVRYRSLIEAVSGFEKGLSGHGFEVTDRVDAGGKTAGAKQEMTGILEQHDDITAVMCANDQMALGALAAIQEYNDGKAPDDRCTPFIYGIGGSPSFKKILFDASSMLTGTAAAMPVSAGQDAAEAAFALINGDETGEEILEKPYLIDHENIDLYGKDGWQ